MYYPTSRYFFNQILFMSSYFAEESPFLAQIVFVMKSKFKEYWKEIHIVQL